MLDPDKELALLEREWPRSVNAWDTDTAPLLDDRILSIASRYAPNLARLHQRKVRETRRIEKSYFPEQSVREKSPSVLASKALGRVVPASILSDKDLSSALDPKIFSRKTKSIALSIALKTLNKADQNKWLTEIAKHINLNDSETALALLEQYRIQFNIKK